MYVKDLVARKETIFLSKSQTIVRLSFIPVTAVVVYYTGIMGAVISVLAANFLIQFCVRYYARKLGSKVNFDSYYWPGIIIFALFVFATNFLSISFMQKIIISILVIIIFILLHQKYIIEYAGRILNKLYRTFPKKF